MGFYGGAGSLSALVIDADLNMGAYNLLTDDIKEHTGAHGVDVDGVIMKDGVIGPGYQAKKASANLRNSHDAEVHDERADGSTWVLAKTFTLTNGISGTLRFTCRAKGENVHVDNKFIWAKNSKAADLGVEYKPENTAWQQDSQDVSVGVMEIGETIEIYTKCNNWTGVFIDQARISYDDDDSGAVGMTNS